MTSEERTILRNALMKYGQWAQILMCIEECAELTNALAKLSRNRVTQMEIITELADVSIMVDQLAMMFGEKFFAAERDKKINRLKERLEKARKGDQP
jgi:NTP pyrophosphatase (non-canonical NTP hydrolase)